MTGLARIWRVGGSARAVLKSFSHPLRVESQRLHPPSPFLSDSFFGTGRERYISLVQGVANFLHPVAPIWELPEHLADTFVKFGVWFPARAALLRLGHNRPVMLAMRFPARPDRAKNAFSRL
jgi:hypothetical protein